MQALCVLGNQLFPDQHLKPFSQMPVFMAEDQELCTYYRFHKHKIILFLSAMRHFRQRISKMGFTVDYQELQVDGDISYIERLKDFVHKRNVKILHLFEVEDKFMESRLLEMVKQIGIELRWHKSPMFTCDREEFARYLDGKKKPFMKTFYESQRRRLGILMEEGKP